MIPSFGKRRELIEEVYKIFGTSQFTNKEVTKKLPSFDKHAPKLYAMGCLFLVKPWEPRNPAIYKISEKVILKLERER
jgi:hypothetical protein